MAYAQSIDHDVAQSNIISGEGSALTIAARPTGLRYGQLQCFPKSASILCMIRVTIYCWLMWLIALARPIRPCKSCSSMYLDTWSAQPGQRSHQLSAPSTSDWLHSTQLVRDCRFPLSQAMCCLAELRNSARSRSCSYPQNSSRSISRLTNRLSRSYSLAETLFNSA